MKKKMVMALLAIMVVTLPVSGCGKKKDSTAKEVTTEEEGKSSKEKKEEETKEEKTEIAKSETVDPLGILEMDEITPLENFEDRGVGESKEPILPSGSWKPVTRPEEVKPVIPTNPEKPDVPTDPEEPDVPTDPEEPDVPTDPEEPDVPTDPEEPDVPTDPEEPDVPTDPEEPDVPTDPEEPDVPTDPEEGYVYDTKLSRAIFEEINKVRAENGLELLEWEDRYCNMSSKLSAAYNAANADTAESLANHSGDQIGYGQVGGTINPAEVVAAWMASDVHRAAILNKDPVIASSAVAVVTYTDADGVTHSSVITTFSADKEILDKYTDEELVDDMLALNEYVTKDDYQQYLDLAEQNARMLAQLAAEKEMEILQEAELIYEEEALVIKEENINNLIDPLKEKDTLTEVEEPDMMEGSEVPEEPDASTEVEEPDMPEGSEVPEEPGASTEVEEPDMPEGSEVPEEPDASTEMEEPDMPEEVDIPEELTDRKESDIVEEPKNPSDSEAWKDMNATEVLMK